MTQFLEKNCSLETVLEKRTVPWTQFSKKNCPLHTASEKELPIAHSSWQRTVPWIQFSKKNCPLHTVPGKDSVHRTASCPGSTLGPKGTPII